jgi:hypothetical protein
MEKKAMSNMACQGFSELGHPDRPLRSHLMGGEQARIYPVIMIRHICMPNLRRNQNPFPQALIAPMGVVSPQMRAKTKVITLRIQTITRASGIYLWVPRVSASPQFLRNSIFVLPSLLIDHTPPFR